MVGLTSVVSDGRLILVGLFILTQLLYLVSLLVTAYFYSLRFTW